MAQKDMKAALTASLHAEHQAVQERLAKADAYFQTQEAHTGHAATPSPAPEKVMRDGFTMPADDYALIAQLQGTILQAGVGGTKKAGFRARPHAPQTPSPAGPPPVFAPLGKGKTRRPPKREQKIFPQKQKK